MRKLAVVAAAIMILAVAVTTSAQTIDCGRFVDNQETESAGGVVSLWIICDRFDTGPGSPGWGPPIGEIWEIQELVPGTTVPTGYPFPCSRLCSHRGAVGEPFKFELLPMERWQQTLGAYVEGTYFSTPHNQVWGVRRFEPVFWPDRDPDPQVIRIDNPYTYDRTDLPGTEITCGVTFRILASDTLPYYWKTPKIEFSEIFYFPPDSLVYAPWPYGNALVRVIQDESKCRKHEPTLGFTWTEEVKERTIAVGDVSGLTEQTFLPGLEAGQFPAAQELNQAYP